MAHAVKLALAAMLSLGAYAGEASESTDADTTPLATIAATPIAYRLPGEFVAGDMPVNGPVIELKPAQSFTIMKRQVSEADYAAWLADSKKKYAALENDATRVASK